MDMGGEKLHRGIDQCGVAGAIPIARWEGRRYAAHERGRRKQKLSYPERLRWDLVEVSVTTYHKGNELKI
jgi:hypothetical protein